MLTRYTKGRVELRNDGRTLFGYAAVYYDGTPDTEYHMFEDLIERVNPGAFDQVLTTPAEDVRGTFDHRITMLLGRRASGTLKLGSDQRGLWYEIDLGSTTTHKDTKEYIERGDVFGSSFSFKTRPGGDHWSAPGIYPEIRTLTNVMLFDLGPVIDPAYMATTAETRSEGQRPTRPDLSAEERARVARIRSLTARMGGG